MYIVSYIVEVFFVFFFGKGNVGCWLLFVIEMFCGKSFEGVVFFGCFNDGGFYYSIFCRKNCDC